MGWLVTLLGMVGDLDDHDITCVQNFRPLGALDVYISYNGVGSKKGKRWKRKEKKRKKENIW